MSLVIPLAISLAVGIFFLNVMGYAVVFSKTLIALLITFCVSNEMTLVANHAALNFLVCGGIVFACGFLLCTFPRIGFAYQYFCTGAVTYVCASLVYGIASSLIPPLNENQLLAEICIKITSLAFATYATILQIQKKKHLVKLNFHFLIMVERIVSSVIYGGTVVLLVCSSNIWYCGTMTDIAVFTAVALLTFVLDILFMGKLDGCIRNGQRSDSLIDNPNNSLTDADMEEYRAEMLQAELEWDRETEADLAFADYEKWESQNEQDWNDRHRDDY